MGTRFGVGICAAWIACAACSAGNGTAGAPDLGTRADAGAGGSAGSVGGSGGGAPSGGNAGLGSDTGSGGAAPRGVLPCLPAVSGTPLARDASFQAGGPFQEQEQWVPADVKMDPQGRVVAVGGSEFESAASNIGVLRFDATGAPDTAFGPFQTYGVRSVGALASVLGFDAKGRIVIGGGAIAGGSTSPTKSLVLRLLADGSIDTSFAASGATPGSLVFLPRYTGGTIAEPNLLRMAFDGSNLFVQAWSGVTDRLLEDGTPDPNFVSEVGLGAFAFFGDTLYGSWNGTFLAWSRTGMPSAGFGMDGVSDQFPVKAMAFAGLPDGSLYAVGFAGDVLHLLPDGTPDAAFGTKGVTASSGCSPKDVRVLCDGGVAFLGNPSDVTDSRLCATVLGPHGEVAAGAPAHGYYAWAPSGAYDKDFMMFDPQGRIVVYSYPVGAGSTAVLDRYAPPWATP